MQAVFGMLRAGKIYKYFQFTTGIWMIEMSFPLKPICIGSAGLFITLDFQKNRW
jgi:hypothetical protein